MKEHQNKVNQLFLPIIVVLALLSSCSVFAKRIAVLYRGDIHPYKSIVKAVEARKDDSVMLLDISGELHMLDRMRAELTDFQPDVLVSVGSKALKIVRALHLAMPVLFCMVLNPRRFISNEIDTFFIGVGMYVDPGEQAEIFRKAFSKIKNL